MENNSVNYPPHSARHKERESLWSNITKNQLTLLVGSLVVALSAFYFSQIIDGKTEVTSASGLRDLIAEVLKEFAFIVFSVGFFEFFKELLLKEEEETSRKEAMVGLLDNAREAFSNELDDGKNILAFGLKSIQPSLDSEGLKGIIAGLGSGDSLYCHVGCIPSFPEFKNTIVRAAKRGANLYFLSLSPYCMNSTRRAGELDEDTESYANECKNIPTTIHAVHKALQELSEQNEGATKSGKVEFKLYRSLMSIPFYIIASENKLPVAYTGFHLSDLSAGGPHLKWLGKTPLHNTHVNDELERGLTTASDSDLTRLLYNYWTSKWSKCGEEYDRINALQGNWSYEALDSDGNRAYSGICTIKEEAGSLRASGTRLETISKARESKIRVHWSTNIVHKYYQNEEFRLITSHVCCPSGSAEVTVFMKLLLKTLEMTTLEGDYYITGSPDKSHFPALSGKITFIKKVPDLQAH